MSSRLLCACWFGLFMACSAAAPTSKPSSNPVTPTEARAQRLEVLGKLKQQHERRLLELQHDIRSKRVQVRTEWTRPLQLVSAKAIELDELCQMSEELQNTIDQTRVALRTAKLEDLPTLRARATESETAAEELSTRMADVRSELDRRLRVAHKEVDDIDEASLVRKRIHRLTDQIEEMSATSVFDRDHATVQLSPTSRPAN